MGGKNAKPKIPSYEPYQCCPATPAQGTKVAKVTKISPIAKDKGKFHGAGRTDKPQLPGLKPINKLTAKDSKKLATISPRIDSDAKESKSKAKKGFFGSGKYLVTGREVKWLPTRAYVRGRWSSHQCRDIVVPIFALFREAKLRSVRSEEISIRIEEAGTTAAVHRAVGSDLTSASGGVE